MQVNVHEAKTQFSRLLERARLGEEIVIAKAGRPVAKLVPIVPEVRKRQAGSARGEVRVGADFDERLPGQILSSFD